MEGACYSMGMAMTVYVLLVNDRHVDPELTVYADRAVAMAAARAEAEDREWPEDEAPYANSEWLFAAEHRTEGDTLQLYAREVIS